MKKKKPAFTLMEIIIALAFTVTILGIAGSMLNTGNKVFSDSDIKTTLQIEGQAIQEKISDIGMQATGIKTVTISTGKTNEIDAMLINSYYKTTEAGASYDLNIKKIDSGKTYKDGSEIYQLWIDNTLISNDVKSVTLDDNVIDNIKTLKNVSSTEFIILLRKEQGYSNVQQTVDFRVTFRNK